MDGISQTIIESQSKSTQQAYNRVWASYNKFRNDKPHSEELIQQWVTAEAKEKLPTTLWTEVSLLCKYLEHNENFIFDRSRINSFLKVLSSSHKKKQAPAFSSDDIFQFLNITPNLPENLTLKLFVLISYFCALQISEAVELKFSSIERMDNGLLVSFIRKKTDKAKNGETKLVPRHDNALQCAVMIFNQYRSLVSVDTDRLWMKYSSTLKKFVNTPIGKNSLALFGRKVAIALHKSDPETYTAHCF